MMLMNRTKRHAREGVCALFPTADLREREEWLNGTIDRLLTEM